MKQFQVEFTIETEDDADLSDVSRELDQQLSLWIDSDETSVLRAFQRDVVECHTEI